MGGGKVRYALTIPSGGTESNALEFNQLRFASEATIHAAAALSGAITIEVTDVREPGASDWRELTQPDGTAITITAGEAIPIPNVDFYGLRLSTTVAPGADEAHSIVLGEVG